MVSLGGWLSASVCCYLFGFSISLCMRLRIGGWQFLLQSSRGLPQLVSWGWLGRWSELPLSELSSEDTGCKRKTI